jgi:myo-inositol-1(or 4)-monophosphatase
VTPDELKSLLVTAETAVREAGAYARTCLGQVQDVQYKGETDPVTAVDRYNEALMVRLIQANHPHHGIVGEEGTQTNPNSAYRWYLDPLDGTVNYAHGLPWFSVSAAVQLDGVTQAGAIYCPTTDELFTAIKGAGAYLNGSRIRVSSQTELKRALLGTGFPYDVAGRLEAILTPLRGFLAGAQGVRRVGSACMDLCQVACGRYDGFWELGLHEWDVAAGFLIIREAGGRVTNFDGDEGDLIIERVVASNGHLHDLLLGQVSSSRTQ